MKLENIFPTIGAIKKRKRIGRGQGTGKGGTSTRGHKGAKSRSGFSKKIGFEGGQIPLQRRIPKFGFKKKTIKSFNCININLLQILLNNRIIFREYMPNIFIYKKIPCISNHNMVKILGYGRLTYALKVFAHKFSKSSIKSIKNVGGEVIHLL